MSKRNIELYQEFYAGGKNYICVGHDDDLIWGVTDLNSIEEAKGFSFYECSVKSEFNLTTEV